MARPSTASAASLTTSCKVGCAWHTRAMSSLEAPNDEDEDKEYLDALLEDFLDQGADLRADLRAE